MDGFLTWNSRRGAHPTTSPLSGTLTSWSSSPTLMSGCGAVPETEGAPGASVFTLHFPLLSRGPPPTHQPGTALAPVCQGGVGVGDKGGRTRPQHQSQAPGSFCLVHWRAAWGRQRGAHSGREAGITAKGQGHWPCKLPRLSQKRDTEGHEQTHLRSFKTLHLLNNRVHEIKGSGARGGGWGWGTEGECLLSGQMSPSPMV